MVRKCFCSPLSRAQLHSQNMEMGGGDFYQFLIRIDLIRTSRLIIGETCHQQFEYLFIWIFITKQDVPRTFFIY